MKGWNTALGKGLTQPKILITYFHIDLAIFFFFFLIQTCTLRQLNSIVYLGNITPVEGKML